MSDPAQTDIIHMSWQDYRPHPNPEMWENIFVTQTHKPCPDCGIGLGLMFGPDREDGPKLEQAAQLVMREYPVELPDGFTDDYETPVYVYCDAPDCVYHGVIEWMDLLPRFDAWMRGPAPLWSDIAPEPETDQEGEQ